MPFPLHFLEKFLYAKTSLLYFREILANRVSEKIRNFFGTHDCFLQVTTVRRSKQDALATTPRTDALDNDLEDGMFQFPDVANSMENSVDVNT